MRGRCTLHDACCIVYVKHATRRSEAKKASTPRKDSFEMSRHIAIGVMMTMEPSSTKLRH